MMRYSSCRSGVSCCSPDANKKLRSLSVSVADADHRALAPGDGQLYNYHIDPSSGSRSERKRISLGTKPITLHKFSANGASYVFAASDRPTVIYSSNQKLLYSNLNENEVGRLHPGCSHTPSHDSLADSQQFLRPLKAQACISVIWQVNTPRRD